MKSCIFWDVFKCSKYYSKKNTEKKSQKKKLYVHKKKPLETASLKKRNQKKIL